MSNYCIYRHMSPSGKSYIGLTKNYQQRCLEHKNKSVNENVNCRYFGNAIKKWGWDNFEHEILESGLTLEEANRKESLYIKIFDSVAPNGYNLQSGGKSFEVSESTRQKQRINMLGRKMTKESNAKISEANRNRGPRSEETKQRIRDANLGKVMSEETKQKIRETTLKRFELNPVSEETRKKKSEAAKKQWASGVMYTEEIRKKMSKPKSEEHRAKIAERNRNMPPITEETRQKLRDARARRGPVSEETRAKISESNRRRSKKNEKEI